MSIHSERLHRQTDLGTEVDEMLARVSLTQAPEPHHANGMYVARDEENYYVELSVPGLERESIDVTVERDSVTISGTRKTPHQQGENGRWIRNERWHGKFEQRIPIPPVVDRANVTAHYKHGIFLLTFPKTKSEGTEVEVNDGE